MNAEPGLGIAEVAARSGIDQRVLRVWESRHGFPVPRRLPNGRRAYTDRDVADLRDVVALRDTGLSLSAAIKRVRDDGAAAIPEGSIFAGLRMQRPDLSPSALPKGLLTVLSKAIEDEYCAHGDRGVVFGSFQAVRNYQAVERRWRDIALHADLCCVFADFGENRKGEGAPTEVSVPIHDAFAREWSVVCDSPSFNVCLLARERPGQSEIPDEDRLFDTLWSVEPTVTRAASKAALALARDAAPELFDDRDPDRLTSEAVPSSEEVKALTALTNRMMAYTASR